MSFLPGPETFFIFFFSKLSTARFFFTPSSVPDHVRARQHRVLLPANGLKTITRFFHVFGPTIKLLLHRHFIVRFRERNSMQNKTVGGSGTGEFAFGKRLTTLKRRSETERNRWRECRSVFCFFFAHRHNVEYKTLKHFRPAHFAINTRGGLILPPAMVRHAHMVKNIGGTENMLHNTTKFGALPLHHFIILNLQLVAWG